MHRQAPGPEEAGLEREAFTFFSRVGIMPEDCLDIRCLPHAESGGLEKLEVRVDRWGVLIFHTYFLFLQNKDELVPKMRHKLK